MIKKLDLVDAFANRRDMVVDDDFTWYVTAHGWSSLAADTNTAVTAGDVAGGVLTLDTGDANNNNEVAVYTTKEVLIFAQDRPIAFESRIQFTDMTSNAGNIAVGFVNAPGANLLVDDGAGIKTTFYGAAIYKVDGGTKWICASSNGAYATLGTLTTSNVTAGGSSYQTLRIEAQSTNGTNQEVTFFCDGVQMRDSNNVPIKHTVANGTVTTAEASAFAYAKAGASTANFLLLVDYIKAAQLRPV